MKQPMTLVTIVTEGILKDKIATLIMKHGATGYTVVNSDGKGSRGNRTMHWEGPNARFETLVNAKTAEKILEDLQINYFENFSIVAWESEVSVLRADKFDRVEEN